MTSFLGFYNLCESFRSIPSLSFKSFPVKFSRGHEGASLTKEEEAKLG